jgi:cytochrome P450
MSPEPTAQSRCPVVRFDHQSAEHSADPAQSYRKLRETTPVAYTESYGGYWVLSDYESVFAAARDDELFSSERSSHGGEGLSVTIPKTPMHFHIPIELDPPRFRPYRKIMNRFTAPAAIERLEDMVKKYTTWFIDDIIETGKADINRVIGVPAVVTVDWLGLRVKDWEMYSRAHHASLNGVPGTPMYIQGIEIDLPKCSAQMHEVISARRADPQDDVISYLVQQEIDGELISEDDVFSMVELLLAGGTGTTASLVSNTVVWLYKNPAVRQDLIDHPDKLERAIEEFLRYFSPTQSLARTVTRDADFLGCPIRAGDRALLAWSSANRDEKAFENANEVDIERWPNRHTAFGIGIHRCAGSHLGRAMAKELLDQILTRMPDYVVALDELVPYPHQGTNTGYQSVPVTFTPGPRLGQDLELGDTPIAPAGGYGQ